MTNEIASNIHTPEDLGNAWLGSPNDAIVPPKQRIPRAEFGRRLAEMEDGIFTPSGYFVPNKKNRGNKDHEE